MACAPIAAPPPGFEGRPLTLSADGLTLSFTQAGEGDAEDGGAADLIKQFAIHGIDFKTIEMHRSSLEDIFVDLVGKRP